MSIIPASRLSSSELAALGNNLRREGRPRPVKNRRLVAAVNRSLAAVGESVGKLHRPLAAVS